MSKQTKTYAGIGSREINATLSRLMIELGVCFGLSGYQLRSGGADGSDTSFETGAKLAAEALARISGTVDPDYAATMEIFLPWSGFNGRTISPGYSMPPRIDEARAIAEAHHPNWAKLKNPEKLLMARNSCQILGGALDRPSNFAICYSVDGAKTGAQTSSKTGGTGQAIRVADTYNVRAFNLGNDDDNARLRTWTKEFRMQALSRWGIDVISLVDSFFATHTGIQNARKGDLVAMAGGGQFDAIAHGCNCWNTMGAGIAKQIAERFPEAEVADAQTKQGDRRKLGTYTVGHGKTDDGGAVEVINAYTQYRYGKASEGNVDYAAIRRVMKQIALDYKGKRIGIPRIGAGNAGGCWVTISNIIAHELRGIDHTLVDLP